MTIILNGATDVGERGRPEGLSVTELYLNFGRDISRYPELMDWRLYQFTAYFLSKYSSVDISIQRCNLFTSLLDLTVCFVDLLRFHRLREPPHSENGITSRTRPVAGVARFRTTFRSILAPAVDTPRRK